MGRERAVRLFIDPPTHHFLEDRLFDADSSLHAGENIREPYIAIRDHFAAHDIPVHTADRLEDAGSGALDLYVSFGMLERHRRLLKRPGTLLSAFIPMECPAVEPSLYRALPALAPHFRRLLSWSHGAALEPYVGERLAFERFHWPQSLSAVVEPCWSNRDRGFLVLINANKLPRLYRAELYTKRVDAIEFFHRYREIDVHGPGWTRMPGRVGRTRVPATARRLYRVLWEARQRVLPIHRYAAAAEASRGPVASKVETLGRYDFCLCFENMILEGWITEKIFDCFFAGTIPVYWGAPDIGDQVPEEAFIDMRRYGGFAELRAALHGMSAAEKQRRREAARAFVESPAFDRFSIRAFVDLFRRMVRADADVDV